MSDTRPGTPRDRLVAAVAAALAVVHLGVGLAGLLAFLGVPGWPAGVAGPADGAALGVLAGAAALAAAWRAGRPADATTRARRLETAGGLVVLPAAWGALLVAFLPRTFLGAVPFELLPLAANVLPALAVLVVVYGYGPFAAGPDAGATGEVDLRWNERE